MTTKVVIVNYGPKAVWVRGIALDEEGKRLDFARATTKVMPETSTEIVCHQHESIEVFEDNPKWPKHGS